MVQTKEWLSIATSLTKAQEAVQADHDGNYRKAVELYKESILKLDAHVLVCVSDEEREKLIEIMTNYTNRVDLILTNIPEIASHDSKNAEFEFQESLPIGSLPEAPPVNVLFRPYWLMKLLAQTMTRGGYMTAKLYVPKNVWFQLGAKFTAIETKFTSCETILIYLQKIKDVDMGDTNMITKELEEFCQQLDQIQNSLARKLRFINEIKGKETKLAQMGSKITKSMERLQANVMRLRIDDDAAYIELLVEIFEISQVFPQWLTRFENEPVILGKLKRVSDFFYSVLCAFVIRDFNMLLERYMKKTRHAFVNPC